MIMKLKTFKLLAVAIAAGLSTQIISAADQTADWKAGLISPVANPIYFEDARITSELRPIFMNHWLPDTFKFAGGSAPLGGEARVYALQIRYAISDRLAFIATKDGYIEFKPNHTLTEQYGWADLAAGFKYALVDDADKQLLITPGLTITLPTGDKDVFQGDGSGEWNLFVSAAKGWNNLHLLGNLGFRIPNDSSEQTSQAHYSLQLDYRTCDYFIPFIVLNGYTVLSEGDDQLLGAVPLNTEMYDLANFGSTNAKGDTQLTIGGGFRSQLTDKLDVGLAYEAGISDPKGIFDKRVTVDMIVRF